MALRLQNEKSVGTLFDFFFFFTIVWSVDHLDEWQGRISWWESTLLSQPHHTQSIIGHGKYK